MSEIGTNPDARYRVMGTLDGTPYVVCQPLTAREALAFVQGCADKGFYIEPIMEQIRPACVTH